MEKTKIFKEVAGHFSLGDIISVVKTTTGKTNSSFFVLTVQGEYVVRFMAEFQEDRFDNERKVQLAATRSGILTSTTIASPNGEYVHKSTEGYVTVSKKIRGVHPSRPANVQHCYAVGAALGRFHAEINPSLNISNSFFFLDYKKNQAMVSALDDELLNMLQSASSFIGKGLPTGVLHGDLHGDNILIDGDRVGMIDLQSVGVGEYILDIGKTVADICSEEGCIDRDRLDFLLRGYESERQLTSNEKASLNAAIMYAATCTAAWGARKGVGWLRDEFTAIGRSLQR